MSSLRRTKIASNSQLIVVALRKHALSQHYETAIKFAKRNIAKNRTDLQLFI